MSGTIYSVMWCHVAEKGVLSNATMNTVKTDLISTVLI
jgi:hypothetical protein